MPPVNKRTSVTNTDGTTTTTETATTPTPGRYTEVNRKCSTIIDKKTKATCDLYPADHEWTEPEKPARNDGESDAAYARRIAADADYQGKRNEAQYTRGKVHQPALSSCQQYTDDPDREPD